MLNVTSEIYHPLLPFGAVGLSVATLTGAVLSILTVTRCCSSTFPAL
ncbi:hypothetical protein [Paenibacillus allorhizoplanae]|nr:hypothetical protein [Paenibacillus allorhizoplanae]